MALILYDKEYVFNEEIVLKDKETGNAIFEYEIKITDEEAQKIKELFRQKEVKETDEITIREIFFKDRYDELVEKIGKFKVEEFTDMILGSLLGKLGSVRQRNFNYATTKYQKNMKK